MLVLFNIKLMYKRDLFQMFNDDDFPSMNILGESIISLSLELYILLNYDHVMNDFLRVRKFFFLFFTLEVFFLKYSDSS